MRCNQDAFTLWEMLLTISLITTIALLSWQPLQMWLSMQQLSYVRYNWQQFIFQARQQAIINNTIVAICPLAANNWSGGAYSFFNPLLQDIPQYADQVISQINSPSPIILNSNLARTCIKFNSNGSTRGTFATFTFSYNNIQQSIIINLGGRIAVSYQ